YLFSHYNKGPDLHSFPNIDLLKGDNKNMSVAEVVVHNFSENKIVPFIGNILINHYKTKDPSQQAIWNSDTVRNSFIVKKGEWVIDKNGLMVSEYFMDPIINGMTRDVNKLINELHLKICA